MYKNKVNIEYNLDLDIFFNIQKYDFMVFQIVFVLLSQIYVNIIMQFYSRITTIIRIAIKEFEIFSMYKHRDKTN